MFCNQCGKEIGENLSFCPHCGSVVQTGKGQEIEKKTQSNGMAIAGFVCSFFIPLLGWIFGGIGFSRSKERNGNGRKLSIAAILIASMNFALPYFLFIGIYILRIIIFYG